MVTTQWTVTRVVSKSISGFFNDVTTSERLPTLLWLPVKSYLVAITMATDFVSLITETYGGSRSSLVFTRTGTMTTNMLRSFFHIHYFQLRCFTVSSHDKQSNTHTCMIIDPPDSPSIRMFLPFLNCKFKPVCEISRRKGMGKGGGRQEKVRKGKGGRRWGGRKEMGREARDGEARGRKEKNS